MKNEMYACIECGFETPKWMGKCIRCGKWGSLKLVQQDNDKNISSAKGKKSKILKFNPEKLIKLERSRTGFKEFDRVLGGGFVDGEVILIGGEPGIGKTTFLLQVINNLINKNNKCVYISAEETLEQIGVHSKRLGIHSKFDFISDDNVDTVINSLVDKKYKLVIVDSIQTVKSEDIKGLTGGVGQVKVCTEKLVDFAKRYNTSIILVGHITKGGDLAGPKVIEHLVDAVFYLEGEASSNIRIIRSFKNRFGSTRDIGVFTFEKDGFIDAENPAEIFIRSKKPRMGICKGVVFEGRRAILIEIQALITNSIFSVPQRVVSGILKSKIQMLCAVLTKYTRANFLNKDVYINIANGLKSNDSSLDLALCIALLSSYFNKKINPLEVAIGEVSLTGQIYSTDLIFEKVKSLKSLGYVRIALPLEALKVVENNKYAMFFDSVNDLINKHNYRTTRVI